MGHVSNTNKSTSCREQSVKEEPAQETKLECKVAIKDPKYDEDVRYFKEPSGGNQNDCDESVATPHNADDDFTTSEESFIDSNKTIEDDQNETADDKLILELNTPEEQ